MQSTIAMRFSKNLRAILCNINAAAPGQTKGHTEDSGILSTWRFILDKSGFRLKIGFLYDDGYKYEDIADLIKLIKDTTESYLAMNNVELLLLSDPEISRFRQKQKIALYFKMKDEKS